MPASNQLDPSSNLLSESLSVEGGKFPASHPFGPRSKRWEICHSANQVTVLACEVVFSLLLIFVGDNFVKLNYVNAPYVVTDSGDVILDIQHDKPYLTTSEVAVTDGLLLFFSIVIPSCSLLVFSIFFTTVKSDTFNIFSVLVLAVGLGEGVTAACKKYVGRLRPNFFNMCAFSKETFECSADEALILQSRKSFPSGHSSLSFCTYTVLSLYLLGKIGLFSYNARYQYSMSVTSPLLRKRAYALLSISVMVVPAIISMTRIRDQWHFPSDVIAGALVGVASASFCYSLHYGPVFGEGSEFPIEQKIEAENLRKE